MHKPCILPVFLLVLPLSAAAETGEAVYEKHCAQCHSSGDVNVPQIGSTEQWKFRSGYGAKSLLYSVKNGHNLMPAQGEMLKDEDISAAIDYMVSKSGGWAKP
ncbi:MAG TPA: cytochrome c [Thiobacillaceae bacterium]|nr:cytochrome c [Thiobacillaceae bacterium]